MSYLSKSQIEELEQEFGVPLRREIRCEISEPEFTMLRNSRKNERSHDVTLFIFLDDGYGDFVAISKHMFPEGIYRAPSGAVHPGEDFVVGAKREGLEETGLAVEFDRFILQIEVTFTHGEESEPWTSYVFTAFTESADLHPIDTQEIKEARWVTFGDLQGDIRERMLATGAGLFCYRVFLHDEATRAIDALRRESSGQSTDGGGQRAGSPDTEVQLRL
ncbi:MAG: NUDIX hydrolase [Actinobacteria bacterium]|nr:NUDIX hydrolase [Actinomycetota bacterium]